MTNLTIETIYTTLWDKMLYQVCMKYTNDLSVAQDWCQNGFIKVYNNHFLTNYAAEDFIVKDRLNEKKDEYVELRKNYEITKK